jgi:dynein heavy chain
MVRLWVHECHRVWHDRLLFPEDRELYMGFMKGALKEFQDVKEDDAFAEPLIFTSFVAACEGHEATYVHIKSTDHLKGVLEAKLEEYNE